MEIPRRGKFYQGPGLRHTSNIFHVLTTQRFIIRSSPHMGVRLAHTKTNKQTNKQTNYRVSGSTSNTFFRSFFLLCRPPVNLLGVHACVHDNLFSHCSSESSWGFDSDIYQVYHL